MALLIYTSGTTGAPKACFDGFLFNWVVFDNHLCLQGIVYDHSHLMHGVHFFGEQCALAALGRQCKTKIRHEMSKTTYTIYRSTKRDLHFLFQTVGEVR